MIKNFKSKAVVLAEDINNILIALSKKYQINSVRVPEILINSMVSPKDVERDLKEIIKESCKSVSKYINNGAISKKTAKSVHYHIDNLVEKTESLSKELGVVGLDLKRSLYECMNLLGTLSILAKKNSVLMAKAIEWHREINRFNVMSEPSLILKNISREFVFFSEENADLFLRSVYFDGLDSSLKEECSKKIYPYNEDVEDSIASEICKEVSMNLSHILNSGYKTCKSFEYIMMQLNVCAELKCVSMFNKGQISSLFLRIVERVKKEIVINGVCINSNSFKDNIYIKHLIDSFVNALFFCRRNLFSSKDVEKIYRLHKDNLTNKKILFASSSKKINIESEIDFICENVKSIVKNKTPKYIIDLIDYANNISNNVNYNNVNSGLLHSTYCEHINFLSDKNTLLQIHNFFPFSQNSVKDVFMHPEYLWFMNNVKYKHVSFFVEGRSIWHNSGRCSISESIKSTKQYAQFNIDMESSVYIYGNEHKDFSLLLINTSNALGLSREKRCLIGDFIDRINLRIPHSKESNLFIIDILYAISVISCINKEKAKSFAVIDSCNKGTSVSLKMFIDLILNVMKGDISDTILIDSFMKEAIIRPMHIDGSSISEYNLHRLKNFIVFFSECLNKKIFTFMDLRRLVLEDE